MNLDVSKVHLIFSKTIFLDKMNLPELAEIFSWLINTL